MKNILTAQSNGRKWKVYKMSFFPSHCRHNEKGFTNNFIIYHKQLSNNELKYNDHEKFIQCF